MNDSATASAPAPASASAAPVPLPVPVPLPLPLPLPELRLLTADDLDAYKALRDDMLAAHPEAFTSDAATELARTAQSYWSRLGLDVADGGQFVLGAWQHAALVGALGSDRDSRIKVRHTAQLIGMMVRPALRGTGLGARLLSACIARLRATDGIEMLTLTVTQGNRPAIALYERAGFTTCGSQPRAIRVGDRYHAKDQMVLAL